MKRVLLVLFVLSLYAMLSSLALDVMPLPKQLDEAPNHIVQTTRVVNYVYMLGWVGVVLFSLSLFSKDIMKFWTKITTMCLIVVALTTTGCWRQFKPVEWKDIETNEEAFLIPMTTDFKAQESAQTEESLKANMVYAKQVQMPKKWVPLGYEWFGVPNGQWVDDAILVKVKSSPITREWTAEANSGTSNKNEAIWVMTADQVEFSTGWTCTARIKDKDSAVKFLHYYPAGSLESVVDTEVRSRVQTAFGIEVTDLPMEQLRLKATPHIEHVVKDVIAFFATRGVEITNLGISGGFVYKDESVKKKLVEVFNAEQEKALALAATMAQEQKNKTIFEAAEGKAKALMTEKKAEADAIKLVADAKSYEIEKAKGDLPTYIKLKQIEIEKAKLEKWDGKYPTTFMGGNHPDSVLFTRPLPVDKAPVDAK